MESQNWRFIMLSDNPDANYNIYALVLLEREAEIEQKGGKLLLTA